MAVSAKQMGTKRYSTQTVTRYRLDGHKWVEITSYDDATVRDQGRNGGILATQQAMLRAYSNDPDFFGNEDYQNGNGIRIVTKSDAKRYFNDPKMEGWVVDCDSDIALQRIMMDAVLSSHNYGHGEMEYIGMVSRDTSRTPEYLGHPDEYNGFGDLNEARIERWFVQTHKNYTQEGGE